MRTIEMECAVMEYLNIRQNLVVPNVSWGIWDKRFGPLHECDVLMLTKSGYATEVEIKVSKHDLLKDKDKMHGHSHNLIARLYFAVPVKLKDLALSEIPERAGLLTIERYYNSYYGKEKYRVKEVRPCKRNTLAIKWDDSQRYDLARLGCMRILGLKKKVMDYKLNFSKNLTTTKPPQKQP